MLGRKSYSDQEIAAAEAMVKATIHSYKRLPAAAKTEEFEVGYFNRAVLLLDYLFVHRLSGTEGKDGNRSVQLDRPQRWTVQAEPLSSWPMSAGRGLKLPAEKSILKLQNGDPVKLSEDDFSHLATAFFAELRKRFS